MRRAGLPGPFQLTAHTLPIGRLGPELRTVILGRGQLLEELDNHIEDGLALAQAGQQRRYPGEILHPGHPHAILHHGPQRRSRQKRLPYGQQGRGARQLAEIGRNRRHLAGDALRRLRDRPQPVGQHGAARRIGPGILLDLVRDVPAAEAAAQRPGRAVQIADGRLPAALEKRRQRGRIGGLDGLPPAMIEGQAHAHIQAARRRGIEDSLHHRVGHLPGGRRAAGHPRPLQHHLAAAERAHLAHQAAPPRARPRQMAVPDLHETAIERGRTRRASGQGQRQRRGQPPTQHAPAQGRIGYYRIRLHGLSIGLPEWPI